MKFIIFIWFTVLSLHFSLRAQDLFHLPPKNDSYTMSFRLINNMVVIPVEINGKPLSFLLDSGIDKTILFNLKLSDSLELKEIEHIKINGLGEGESLSAIRSSGNRCRIGKVQNFHHSLYVLLDDTYDLSSKLGENVNGIIGGDLLRDFVVEIDYQAKKLTFHKNEAYLYKKCKDCEVFPLEFRGNKPYINLAINDHNNKISEVKLLIDSGGGDALWLFENKEKNIQVPENYFKDYLGKGLSGDIYGRRSRIKELRLGNFVIANPTVAFPDSSSVVNAMKVGGRNGTLGAEILRRFKVVFDYEGKKITLKKSGNSIDDPFLYNKSGIELAYGGDILVKESKGNFVNSENAGAYNTFSEVVYSFNLAYKPTYRIDFLRPDSPALKAGLEVGDIIIEINGKPAYEKKIPEIILMLSKKEGQKINLLVDRNGRHFRCNFVLKDLL